MEQSGFIVGIDLGTSKIVGLLGRKNEQGVVSVLASESVSSDSCIKHGVVYNIDEAAGKIKKIISLLENKSGRKIGKVYVSVSGMSLKALEHTLTKDLGTESEITFSIIDQMELQARSNRPDFSTNYSVVAPEIFLDGIQELDPIGKSATIIEGKYRVIVGRPNIKSNLIKCITDKNQLDIAGFIVGPVAAGAIVLEEEDKQKGCVLVDFGAGTTSVSVYKDGLLRYMVVIPFGGKTITKDIEELGFVDSSSELYKIKYGRVGKDKNKQASNTNSDIDIKELNRVIQLRQEEIILNVLNQIKESGFYGQLDAGLVMIGGASQMRGLTDFIEDKFQMKVRKGIAKRLYINNAADLLQNPAYALSLGLLLFANENCEKIETAQPEVYGSRPSLNTDRNENSTSPNSRNRSTQYQDIDEDEIEDESLERSIKKKDQKKQKTLFDFFGKIQNLGGTMFKDED